MAIGPARHCITVAIEGNVNSAGCKKEQVDDKFLAKHRDAGEARVAWAKPELSWSVHSHVIAQQEFGGPSRMFRCSQQRKRWFFGSVWIGMYISVYKCMVHVRPPQTLQARVRPFLSVRGIGPDGSSQLRLPLVSVGKEFLCGKSVTWEMECEAQVWIGSYPCCKAAPRGSR